MKIAMLGATGRTGRLVIDELARRGHDVVALVRDPVRAGLPAEVAVLEGEARGPLGPLLVGADAVVSALGPVGNDPTLHREVAVALVEAMTVAGVRRFIGVSGAGIDVAGDEKSRRDRVISALMARFGGAMVADKAAEHMIWAASGLDWTLVRPPRLVDSPVVGRVEHHARSSPRATAVSRGDLASFLVDCLEQRSYVGAAPLVGRG